MEQEADVNDSDEDAILRLNGEILENDDDSDLDDDVVFDASAPDIFTRFKNPPHLKGVVPIRLVRERSPRRTTTVARSAFDGETTSEDSDDDHRPRRNVSEGYVTSEELLVLSIEAPPPPGDRLASREDGRKFCDSGVAADGSLMTNSCEEALESVQYSLTPSVGSCAGGGSGPTSFVTAPRPPPLPPPTELGNGNPFMVFLCLTLLLQHRDYVMKNRMDYNEIAMHFDKMVRRHHVARVLHQARALFADYMKERSWAESDSSGESFQDPRDFNV